MHPHLCLLYSSIRKQYILVLFKINSSISAFHSFSKYLRAYLGSLTVLGTGGYHSKQEHEVFLSWGLLFSWREGGNKMFF